MNRKSFSVLLALFILVLTGCRQPVSVCEGVKQPSDLPWLNEMVQLCESVGPTLSSIDKITYSLPNDQTTYVGFYATIGSGQRQIKNIYDCDGKIITEYGGATACIGECDIKILSFERIYTKP